ncbi:hypothetical protein COOONC_22948 [Cooperia oncophora]
MCDSCEGRRVREMREDTPESNSSSSRPRRASLIKASENIKKVAAPKKKQEGREMFTKSKPSFLMLLSMMNLSIELPG